MLKFTLIWFYQIHLYTWSRGIPPQQRVIHSQTEKDAEQERYSPADTAIRLANSRRQFPDLKRQGYPLQKDYDHASVKNLHIDDLCFSVVKVIDPTTIYDLITCE